MKHPRIEAIEARIEPLRKALAQHHLYNRLQTIEDVALFTEQHVFAVWDFMSLLKSLKNPKIKGVTLCALTTIWKGTLR